MNGQWSNAPDTGGVLSRDVLQQFAARMQQPRKARPARWLVPNPWYQAKVSAGIDPSDPRVLAELYGSGVLGMTEDESNDD